MSIPPPIERALAAQLLTRFEPRLSWVQTPRVFLMAARCATQLSDGLKGLGPEDVGRWEKLEADISYFVEGGFVTRALMKQLDPKKYEHWNLRSVRPGPSMRVFGRFAMPDLFVATHVVTRRPLGRKWSQQWEIEKLVSEDHWRQALDDFAPFEGHRYEDYITENAAENVRV